MKIVFVDNLLLDFGGEITQASLRPHLGLISLAAVAEGLGHTAAILDPKIGLVQGNIAWGRTVYRQIAEWILSESPDVVGFTSLGCNFICTSKVAQYVKSFAPDVQVWLGGPHATILHQEILTDFPHFDVIARGEAETILPHLLNAVPDKSFAGIAGITYRSSDGVVANPPSTMIMDLDTLPAPAYDKYPIKELGLRSLAVEAGRGCPFSCTFCSTAPFFGRRYRLKSAEKMVAELDFLHATYGISDFSLTHDLFTVNKVKVHEFCDLVENRGYRWACSARMDCVDEKLLERMGQAGCKSIYYGVEAGSAALQSKIKKRLDLELFHPILNTTLRKGMRPTVSFITGFPEETHEDQMATVDLLGECFMHPKGHRIISQLHLLAPEPGTELFAKLKDELMYDGFVSDQIFPTMEEDDEEIMKTHPEIFMTHYYFPTLLPRQRNIFVLSAIYALSQVDNTVIAHTLSFYEGKLSTFLMRMWEWMGNKGIEGPCDSNLITQFIEEEFGAEHYLRSLFVYAYSARSVCTSLITGPAGNYQPAQLTGIPANASADDERYILSNRVVLLANSHNYPAIIDALKKSRLDEAESLKTDRRNFILMPDPADPGSSQSFEVSADAKRLIELFREPRSVNQCCSLLGMVESGSGQLRSFVSNLIERKILVPFSEEIPQTGITFINSTEANVCG